MLFTSALLSSSFFISEVLADPRRVHRSRMRDRMDNTTHAILSRDLAGTNWAGGVLSGPPGTFYHISGSFVVPEVQGPQDSMAAVWVGIDGDKCQDALLQTGLQMRPDGEGGSEYYAWYEWYPDPPEDFDLFVFTGDIVTLTVTAYSSTYGFATIENLTSGETEHVVLSSEHALCLQEAEWIVEDPEDEEGNQVPFANFDVVQFYDAKASGPAGSYTPDQASPVLIVTPDGSSALTSIAIDEFSITIAYIDN